MHHDAQTAATVRATCVEMLPAYPAEDFVVVTLRTLTQLAAHALVDIPEQVRKADETGTKAQGEAPPHPAPFYSCQINPD